LSGAHYLRREIITMKSSFKHLCASTVLVVFMIGSCHKDNALSGADKARQDSISRADSIHRIDSLHAADSVDHIRMGIDSASGKYWCEYRHNYGGAGVYRDSLLGYDTVIVSRGAGSTQMVVNGEVFTYGSDPYYSGFANGDQLSWNDSLSYVKFRSGYDSVYYTVKDQVIGRTGGSAYYYKGRRIY
jgi:hypothetical protein